MAALEENLGAVVDFVSDIAPFAQNFEFLSRRSIIESKPAFLQKQRERLPVNSVIFSQNVLGMAPKVFLCIDMLLTVHKLLYVVYSLTMKGARCKVPHISGMGLSPEDKDGLWDRYYMGAPQRWRQFVEQYRQVKRA